MRQLRLATGATVTILSIRLFGSGGIGGTGPLAISLPDAWWPVVGCLLSVPGRRMSRSRLAGELWPEKDEAAARHCLANALWRIKGSLPRGISPLVIAEDSIAFSTSRRVWVDSLVFEQRAAAAVADPSMLAAASKRRRLARALALYRSDFLAERDQDTIRLERERLRVLYLDALYELAVAQANALEWGSVRATAATLCLAEPLREDAQRMLIHATACCGNRALAIRLYRDFEALLSRELGVAPMPETLAAVKKLTENVTCPEPVGAQHTDYRETVVRVRDQVARMLAILDDSLRP